MLSLQNVDKILIIFSILVLKATNVNLARLAFSSNLKMSKLKIQLFSYLI